ncbi:MAG: hypothetical protein CMO01_19900 [Thalassobius sp.]|nr:hypothetical protein [Thalassovita sp.]
MVVPDNMDINGNTPFFWTNRFRNMLGYRDETDFPNVLHAWSDLLHPEDKENTLNAFNRHLVDTTGNTPYDVEYKLKLKNGTYKWFRAIGNTVRDYAGKPLRIAGSLIDIQNIKDMQLLQTELENKISERTAVINKLLTESKEQNEELSSQEEELRQNLEEIQATQELLEVKNRELAKSAAESLSISNGINEVMCSIVFSPEGNIISANKNFLNTMGYTLEQIKDKHHRIFVPNEIVESDDYKSFWTRLAEGEAISEIFKRINANGEIVWLNAVYTPIFDDNGIVFKIIKFATNVTDQQKVASEAKSIFKGIDKVMSVIEFTPEGIVNNANKNFLEIMKYKFDDIQGKHHQMFVPKNLRESSDYQSFWKRLSEGEAISEIFNRINADGESVWLNAVYSPIINSEGQVVKVIKLATDISYEKEKEAQVLALLEEAQSQEEELLQNMEELEAIQEDIQQQALEMSSRMNAINESGISSIEFDLQGNILTANSNFLKLMGYALKEIQGKHHSIFVDEDYKNSNAYQEFWEALRQGKAQMGEQKRMKKDGNPVFLYGSYSLIKDILGKPKSVIKLAVDISSIKK